MENTREVLPSSITEQINILEKRVGSRFEFIDCDFIDLKDKGYTLLFKLKFTPTTTSREFALKASTAKILGNHIIAQGNFSEIEAILMTLVK